MKKVELMKKVAEAKEKYSAFKQKPITWGDYIRYAEVSLGISAAIIAAELIYFKAAEMKSRKELDVAVDEMQKTAEHYSFGFGGYADEEEEVED